MAPFAVAITKSVPWRGTSERFSNIYHYDTSSPITTEAGWDALIDAIANKEKELFSGAVNFVEGRVWGPTNEGELASITRRIKDLSGTGAIVSTYDAAPELAVVVSLYMGRNPATQRKTFLRKFWHVRGFNSTHGNAGAGLGTTALPVAGQTFFAGKMNDLKTLTVGGFANDLCKPNGNHIPLGTDAVCLPYLHTRQFKQ